MTLQELINKLDNIVKAEKNKNSDVHFFAEYDYDTFDVEITSVEVQDGKVYLS